MSTLCQVDGCGRPTPDLAYVCQPCADQLARALGDIPALWDELQTTITKQARFTDNPGRGGDKTLPFNPTASEVDWALRNTIATWCRLIADERGHKLPLDNPAAIARWLLHQVTWLRHHRAGPEAVEEIRFIVNVAHQVIDRPAELVFAGRCSTCGDGLYGRLGVTTVECRDCGSTYDVSELQARMWDQAREQLVTAREAALLLGRFGIVTSRKTIEKWNLRKRLVARGADKTGARLYLLDDLVQLAVGDSPDAWVS